MNIKSFATISLSAVALAVTSVAPAFANNNAYLNNLAMQYYMQNQATAASQANLYNSTVAANYVNPYATAYGTAPWAAGALPYGTVTPVVSYSNIVVPRYIARNFYVDRFHHHF